MSSPGQIDPLLHAVPPGTELPTIGSFLERPAWQADAACIEHPELDFVPSALNGAIMRRLFDVCDRCLVREECLEFALADDTLEGVWASTTRPERVRLRRGAAA